MKNTEGLPRVWVRSREERYQQDIKKSPFEDSQRLIILVLLIHKQLTSEQRSQIFASWQKEAIENTNKLIR